MESPEIDIVMNLSAQRLSTDDAENPDSQAALDSFRATPGNDTP
jgi:hypothetical protein